MREVAVWARVSAFLIMAALAVATVGFSAYVIQMVIAIGLNALLS